MPRLMTAAAVVAATFLSVLPAAAQTYDVRFQNDSGTVVYRIYSSPNSNDNWEQDLLGANVLQPGQYLDVTIYNVYDCAYDVLVEFQNGSSFTDTFDLCSYNVYTIR